MKAEWLEHIRSRMKWRLEGASEFRKCLRRDSSQEFITANKQVCWRRLCFAHDEQLGWRFVPGVRARIFQAGRFHTVRTNQLGFRSDMEFGIEKGARLRVVVLGDSYAAGDGVNNRERFSDILMRLLPGVEVLNFAMPGTGEDQQVLTYEQIAARYNADVCLFCAADMDIFRLTVKAWPALEWGTQTLRYRAKPSFYIEQDELRLSQESVQRGMRNESNLKEWGGVDFLKTRTAEDWADSYAATSVQCRLLKAIIKRFFSFVGDLPVFLIPLPSPVHGLGQFSAVYRDVFADLVAGLNQKWFVDVLPAFKSLNTNDREACYLDRDPHFSARGHQVVASAIAEAIGGRLNELAGRGGS